MSLGVLTVTCARRAVGRDFGHGRQNEKAPRSCDRGAFRVASDYGARLLREPADGEAVAQAHAARAGNSGQRISQRGEVRHVQAADINPRGASRYDHHPLGDAQDDGEQLGAPLRRLLLGVVQRRQRATLRAAKAIEVEQHRCGHKRPGETAAPGFVSARDVPESK